MRHTTRIAALLALAALAAAGCGAGNDTTRARADAAPATAMVLAPRDVARADTADLVAGVPVSGTLKPAVDVRIAAPIPEVLDEVLVREGQAIARGQVLARFRTAALAPAAAGAESQMRVAAADYERMKNLLKEGAISEREMEGAEAAWRQAQAQAAYARKRLDEASVRAPVSGTIAKRWVQSGDRVGDGDPLFRLVDTAELEFEATVPAEYAGSLRPGAAVLLNASGDSLTREGRVMRIHPAADPATRQVKLYIRVANADGRLVGDAFATGRVVLARARTALAVPRSAVRSGADGRAFVWLVAGGRAERRPVTTGVGDEARDLVQVTSGLARGDLVITGPAEGLVAGRPVSFAGRES